MVLRTGVEAATIVAAVITAGIATGVTTCVTASVAASVVSGALSIIGAGRCIENANNDFGTLSCTNCFCTTTPSSIEDDDEIFPAIVTKACQLTLGSGVSILSGNTCSYRNEVFYYGTITLGYNDPEAIVTYSLDGVQLSGDSFTINQENAAFDDGSATITAEIETIPTIILADTEDNTNLLSAKNGKTRNVVLSGRTLRAGGWNTFCVPFDISSSQITSVFGAGTKVRELNNFSYNEGTKTLTLNFTNASSIDAGKPYLVYLGSATNVANPTFEGVTISNSTTTTTTPYADFVPVMNPTPLTGGDKTVLFVTGGNKLTYPNTTGNINGFRAYFKLKEGAAANAQSFIMSFDGETTGIVEMRNENEEMRNDGVWHTIDGRILDKQPSSKGIYIVNGRKVVIK